MTKFKYIATKNNNQPINGELEASSRASRIVHKFIFITQTIFCDINLLEA